MSDLEVAALAMAYHQTRESNDAPEFDMDVARARASRMIANLDQQGHAEPQCRCCDEGFYCRHRCPLHPKPNGRGDSGEPWITRSYVP